MNNNEQKLSPGCMAAFAVFFVIAVVANVILDSIMLSMLIGAGAVGGGVAIVWGARKVWEIIDKQKLKKYSVITGVAFLVVITVICIVNASISGLSQEKVKELVIEELLPQTEEVEKELGVSDISVDFDIYEYEYKKPTALSRGYISFKVADYYVSDNFYELNNGIYDNETCNKYRNIDSLQLGGIKIDRHKVDIQRISYSKTEFKDNKGNKYSFNIGQIFKNGYFVYGKSNFDSTSSSDGSGVTKTTKCNWCGGDGKTHDWVDSGRKCTKCGGDGIREYGE